MDTGAPQDPDEEVPYKDFLDVMDSWDEIEPDTDPELEEMRFRRNAWVKPVALIVAISMGALAAPSVVRFIAHLLGH